MISAIIVFIGHTSQLSVVKVGAEAASSSCAVKVKKYEPFPFCRSGMTPFVRIRSVCFYVWEVCYAYR